VAKQTFARRLRELREQAGLTQEGLAERSRISRVGISRLESGAHEPSWSTVEALAAALGVAVTAFAGTSTPPGEEPEPPPKRPPGRPKRPGGGGKAKGRGPRKGKGES
jgi:transcriptional regulator with XRE-family HTH domain